MIEYRQARLSDAQAIGLLHARSFRENVRGEFTDEFLDADLPAELLQLWQGRLDLPPENQFVQVALDDENLLGFVCAYGAHDSQWGSLIDNLHVVHSARKTATPGHVHNGCLLPNKARKMVGEAGFEPAIPCPPVRRLLCDRLMLVA